MTVHPKKATDPIEISVREFRLFVERLLYVTDLPHGLVPAVRDTVLYAEAFGLGGLGRLLDDLEALKSCRADVLTVRDTADAVILDAAGQHAWVAAPAALDLAVEEALAPAPRVVRVENAGWPDGLAVLEGLGYRHHVMLRVRPGAVPEIEATVTSGRTDPVMQRMLADGLRIPADLWWRLYALSHRALTPDSPVSRRHAGPVILTDDGRIIGRQEDEDVDLALIKGADITPGVAIPANLVMEPMRHAD